MKEITWYGRGGQGAFTASRILGAAAMTGGFKSLAFPSFGPERRGAPIRAFTRISRDRIVDRSIVRKNDYIIVLDDTLYDRTLLKSLKENGRILINTNRDRDSFDDQRVLTGDISSYAEEILKRPIVNIGILGMLAAVDPDIGPGEIYKAVTEYMSGKVAGNNIMLFDMIYNTYGGRGND